MNGIHDKADAAGRKPKLVFFQWDHSPNLAGSSYLFAHAQDHVRCLRHYFDVTVVNADCDFAQVCDAHEPELTLFESGYRTHGSRRIAIRNVGANLGVPRIALHNADAWCDRRAGLLSDMEDWRIEAVFAICTLMPDYAPGLGDIAYVWPNFIDPAVYRDYGLPKTTEVFLTGQASSLYPWRRAVFPKLKARFDCTYSSAAPYGVPELEGQLAGLRYAHQINASHLVPTCGTVAGEVVRKHFEIPGSGACLLTERRSGLEEAGFVDMVNCAFADPDDIVDKVGALLSDRSRLETITAAGHALVMERHTLASRPQILQWYKANAARRDGQRIVQDGPFGSISLAETAGWPSRHVRASGMERRLLREGDGLIAEGHHRMAEAKYSECLEYVPYLPEAKLGLAVAQLSDARPVDAKRTIVDLIRVSLVDYGASRPDPVEWAVYLIALIRCGEIDKARRFATFYPNMRTSDLDEIRRALGIVPQDESEVKPARSSHCLPADALASILQAAIAFLPTVPKVGPRELPLRLASKLFETPFLVNRRPTVPPTADFSYARMAARSLVGNGRLRRGLVRGRYALRKAARALFEVRLDGWTEPAAKQSKAGRPNV